eukprot:CCRYP_015036-RC/>CCRYP_015036-RC protein AED:0.48 eAED:1.00 QI:0/0/0/1/1/1/2/0/140
MALTHEALYPFLYRKRHQINFGFEKGLVIAFRTDLGSLSIEDTTSGFLPQSNKLKSHLHLCGGKHHHYELPYLQVLDASVFYEVYFKRSAKHAELQLASSVSMLCSHFKPLETNAFYQCKISQGNYSWHHFFSHALNATQ